MKRKQLIKGLPYLVMGNDKTHPEDDDYNGGGCYDGW